MPDSDAIEFSRRRDLPYVVVRYMHTARTQDIVLSLGGRDIGQKTTVTTRGKSRVAYLLPPLTAPDSGAESK